MKAHLLLATLAVGVSAFAQGTIQLSNAYLPNPTGGGTYEARIELNFVYGEPYRYPGDGGAGYWIAGLFLAGSTTPLGTTTFYSGTGENSQYNWMFAENPVVEVPGHPPGSSPSLFVGVWRASDGLRNALAGGPFGTSPFFTSGPLGGPNPIGAPPFVPPVTTFQPFSITYVPEPSVSALGLFALAAALLRKKS